MKRFKTVYHWNVLDEMCKGAAVFYADKELRICDNLSEYPVLEAVSVLNNSKAHEDRYVFWIEEEIEEEKENKAE